MAGVDAINVIVRAGIFSWTASFAEELYDRIADIPVLNFFFSYGFYVSLAPAWLFVMNWERRAGGDVPCVLALAPLVISIVLGCWLAPVSAHLEGTRYLLPVVSSLIEYRDRPEGSVSKLDTVSDGLRVVAMIGTLFKDYRPLKFFGLVALVLLALGLAHGLPVVSEWLETGLVPRLPTALLAVALVFLSALSLACGLILDSSAKNARRQWELAAMREYGSARQLRGDSK